MGQFDGALDAGTRDLVAIALSGDLPALLFRDTTIDPAMEPLSQGWSVLLTAPPGVGKTSMVVRPGAILRVAEKQGSVTVRVLDTSESRAARREAEPIRLSEGWEAGRAERTQGVADALHRLEAITANLDGPFRARA